MLSKRRGNGWSGTLPQLGCCSSGGMLRAAMAECDYATTENDTLTRRAVTFTHPRRLLMSEKKIIAVVGATGAQGGGLVRAILRDAGGHYRARAITRDPHSEKAQQLASLGAEVVAADVDDENSLTHAFEGAHGAYCVTFYWAHFSPEKERAEAAAMARAAKAAGVGHVIWSTLEDTRKWVPLSDSRMPTLNGKYKVPHFDAKGESDRYFMESGVPRS